MEVLSYCRILCATSHLTQCLRRQPGYRCWGILSWVTAVGPSVSLQWHGSRDVQLHASLWIRRFHSWWLCCAT